MEVKIGVADSPREVVVVSDQTPDEVEKLVRAALNGADDGVLALVDEKGRKVLVQAAKISYVDIGPATLGKVASPPTESDRRERAGACRPGPFVVLGMCRQRRRCSYVVSDDGVPAAAARASDRPRPARPWCPRRPPWGSGVRRRASSVR